MSSRKHVHMATMDIAVEVSFNKALSTDGQRLCSRPVRGFRIALCALQEMLNTREVGLYQVANSVPKFWTTKLPIEGMTKKVKVGRGKYYKNRKVPGRCTMTP